MTREPAQQEYEQRRGAGLRTQPLTPGKEAEYEKQREYDVEADDALTCVLATEPSEYRGGRKGRQVWVKLPTRELCALDLEDLDGVIDLLRTAANRCHSARRHEDVYAVFESRILQSDLSLAEQGVEEGSVLRVKENHV